MIKNQCKIYLQSRQKMGDEEETTDQEYIGELAEREDKRYLSYQRGDDSEEISCLISFDRRSLTITQKGAANSRLELFPGKETRNIYGTPMGNLELGIFTRRYDVVELQDEIRINISYDILTGGEPIRTDMDIKILM